MIPVYQILEAVKDKFMANKAVNTVTFGDMSEVDLNKTTIFPLAHIILSNVRFEGNMLVFTLRLLNLDVVDYSKAEDTVNIFYGNNNLQEVYNTQLQVVNDLIQSLNRGELYSNLVQLGQDPTSEPLKDRYENELAGWATEIDIRIPNDLTICN